MYSSNDKDKVNKPKKPKLDISKLPSSLKDKYEAMGLLPQKQIKKTVVDVDLEVIKQRKLEKEKSIEEKLQEIIITSTETKALLRVFLLLCDSKVSTNVKEISFNAKDIASILQSMGLVLTKSEIDLMLWEIDDDLDGQVDSNEFLNMYKKCTRDSSGLEPKSLFHMVQFLMFCKNAPDKYTITVEDTLELLYVRFGRLSLDQEIHAIFGDEEKTKDGQEKEIDFSQYLDSINTRAIDQRKKRKDDKKELYSFKKKNNENY